MRLPWKRVTRWTFCRECGCQMVHASEVFATKYDRVTGDGVREAFDYWACSRVVAAIADPDDARRITLVGHSTNHDVIYMATTYTPVAKAACS